MSVTWDTVSAKTTPLPADEVLIIDTADSRNQKRATLLSFGGTLWTRTASPGFLSPSSTTDTIRVTTGTELLPAYSFTASSSTGMRYDSTTPALAFSLAGSDVLKLSASEATFAGIVNLPTGSDYQINSVSVLNATTLGSTVLSSSLTSVGTLITGVWNATTIAVADGGTGVTTSTGTVSVVLSSSPTLIAPTFVGVTTGPSGTWRTDGMDIDTGDSYSIGGTVVLNTTTLGSTVVNSSLTSLGTLSSLTITGDLTVDTNTLFVDSTNNKVGIGTITIPHGSVGSAILAIEGDNASNSGGPHVQFTTTTDNFPLLQILPFGHDNVSISFDAYHDGTWKSSDVGSNFQISKVNDSLDFNFASGISQGTLVTWTTGLTLDNSGNVGVGIDAPVSKLHVLETTEQLRLAYDATNYVPFTVSSGGDLTIAPTGGDTNITGNLTVDINTLIVDSTNDRVGIGVLTPLTKLHVLETTEQLRLGFSAGGYASFTVSQDGYDLSTAVYNSVSFGISEDSTPEDVAFNLDGTKMYVLGEATKSVYQYTLTTGFDVSTASYDSVSLSVNSQDTIPVGLAFNSDGTKMYIAGTDNETVYQYTLTTAFDLSTASYASISFSVISQTTNFRSLTFNADGTKMYVVDQAVVDAIFQYTLSTADNVSTASYDSVSFSVSSQDGSPQDVAFNTDGTKMYVLGDANDTVYQYTLSTGFDLSTASYNSVSFSVSSQDTLSPGMTFNADGTKMYVVGFNNKKVFQYSLGTATLTIAPTGGDTNITGNLTVDTDTLFVDSTNNRVGIDTLSPIATLHVETNVVSSTIVPTGDADDFIIENKGNTGYTEAPTVTISAPADTVTGTATAVMDTGIEAVAVTSGGTGYTEGETVTITGVTSSQADATGTVTLAGIISTAAVLAGGTGYVDSESITLTGVTSGATNATATVTLAGIISTAAVLAGGTDYVNGESITLTGVTSGATNATATVVASTSPGPITGITIVSGGTGYTSGETLTVVGGTGTSGTGTATLTGQIGTINIVSGGTGYTNSETLTVVGGTGTSGTGTATLTGQVASVTVTAAGTGYTLAESITITGQSSGATDATVTATISQFVSSITIVLAGQGYVTAPTVTIAAPTSGTTATATSTISNTALSSITVTLAGIGYTGTAGVTIEDAPTKVTATATAVISGGKVTTVTIDTGGVGYVVPPPVVVFTGGDGTGVGVDTTTVSASAVTSITVTQGGSGMTIVSDTAQVGVIAFEHAGQSTRHGRILFDHSDNAMTFSSSTTSGLRIDSDGHVAVTQNAVDLDEVFAIESPDDDTSSRILVKGATNKMLVGYDGSEALSTTNVAAQVIVPTGTDDLILAGGALSTSNVRFYTSSGSTISEAGRFDSSGNFIVDTDTLFVNSTNNKVGIGTTDPGNTGAAKLELEGTASNVVGPHIQAIVSTDQFPVFQNLNWNHDNITLSFDSYFNGSWRSSDVGSNFKMSKLDDLWQFDYSSSNAQGSVISWNTGFVIDTSGNIGVNLTAPLAKFHILETTEQLRLAYDATNFASFTVDSTGDLTIVPSGGTFALTGTSNLTQNMTTSGAGNTAGFFLFNDVGKFHGTQIIGSGASGTFAGVTLANIAKNVTSADNLVFGTQTVAPIVFITNTTDRGRFTTTGDFVIGATSASAKLHVLETTEQLRLAFSTTEYASLTVDEQGYDIATTVYDDVFFSIASEDTNPQAVHFNNDGTKMYFVGNANNTIYQYTLSTAFDLSTASYDSVSFLVGGQDTSPQGMDFNADGTKLYLVGKTTTNVYEYTVSTGFDLSTATTVGVVSFSVGTQDSSPVGIEFNTDGTRMYILGDTTTAVYEYTLTTGYDLSTATTTGVVSFTISEDSLLEGIDFNSDGTRMYIVGDTNDDVFQYTLSTAFDLSTASYDNVFFNVNSEDVAAEGISFNSDGTKMYIIGSATDTVYQYSLDPSTLTIAPTGGHTAITGNAFVSGDLTVDTNTLFVDSTNNNVGIGLLSSISAKLQVLEPAEQLRLSYSLTNHTSFTAGNGELGSATYDSVSFSVSSEDILPTCMEFNLDGTRMFILGQTNNSVYQYTLSTAFVVSSATYDSVSISVNSEDILPVGLEFNTDGTKMYITGAANATIYQYTLTTAFDLSTASYASISKSITTEDTQPVHVNFNIAGTKMHVLGSTNNTVYQYTLSTAFNVSTATYDSVSFSVNSEDTNPSAVEFNFDSTKMYITGDTNNSIYQYTLTTGSDLSTASYDNVSFSVASEATGPECTSFNNELTKMYVVDNTTNTVYQYSLETSSLTIAPTGGTTIFTSTNVDTVPITTITTTGTNPGTSSTFVGSQDTPNGNVVGAGGDIYISDNGALSKPFFNKEATTGTDWEGISLIPDTVHEIFSTAEYAALGTSSIITTSSGTNALEFSTLVISSTRHSITARASELMLIDRTESNGIAYTGSTSFITSTVGGDVTMKDVTIVAGIPGTQLFDYVGDGTLNEVDVVSFHGTTALVGWDLGTIGRVSTSEVGPIVTFKDGSILVDNTASLIIDSVSIFGLNSTFIDQSDQTGFGGPIISIKDSSYKGGRATLFTLTGSLYASESLVRIDAGLPEDYRVNVFNTNLILNGTAAIFDVSGSTGDFTVVANNSISSTAIDSVTDSSGVASFTHTGTSPDLGSLVTVSGFTTNTSYNTTGIVTATTTTTFEVDYVAFGTTEAGSYAVTGVTITSTAHGLTQGTGVTLDTDLSTDYDGGVLIYNIQTNSFDAPLTFTSTNTGSWSTEGLDQTDPRVLATNNPGTAESKAIAEGNTNDNSTATTITASTYAAISVATHTVIKSEGLKLIDATAAIWECTLSEGFIGKLTGNLSGEKTGSTASYRIAMSTNGVVPLFADISSTAISGVTDSSGVASFTHAGTTPPIGTIVTISGFTTNTDYNQTDVAVTASSATTFEVSSIAFGTSETIGSFTARNANYVVMEVKTSTIGTPLEFSVVLDKGDTIQIMMAGDSTSDNITVTDLKTGIQ